MTEAHPAQLQQLLAQLERPGDYVASGTVETATPSVTVDGLPLSFPLPETQARELVARAEPAPYGRGGETLVDPAVRKVWQFAAPRVSLGWRWQRTIDAVVTEAAHGLGVSGPVRAELYKLLVYDVGSFFIEHRDTEKADGMFATLVVVLPSDHRGGELVVRHRDREVRIDLRRDDPAEVGWCAFYADCLHEITPVTAGHRVCLVYNLVREGAPLPAPDPAPAVAALTEGLRAWAARGAVTTPKLVFALEHHYTPKELSFAALKNGDRAAAAALVAAGGRASCEVHLAMVAITETGSAEDNHERSRRRPAYDDGHIEVIEVFDRKVVVEDWRAPDGARPALGPIPIEAGELWPPDAVSEEVPDEQHYHEATGNEGAEFQRTYRRAALVVWPAEGRLAVRVQATPDRTVALLESASSRGEALDVARRILDRWSELRRPASWRFDEAFVDVDAVHRRMHARLVAIADADLAEQFLDAAAAAFRERSSRLDPVPLLALLPESRAAEVAARLVRDARRSSGLGLAQWLVAHERRAVALAAAEALVLQELPRHPTLDDLLGTLALLGGLGMDAEAARFAARAAEGYPTELLVSGLLALKPGRPEAGILRAAVVARLRRDAGPLPDAPADLARPASWPCGCEPCGALRTFLASPTAKSWSRKAADPVRRHLEQVLGTHCHDVDWYTQRTRPPTLVCTKTQARHDAAVRRRAAALEALEKLA